MYAGAIGPSIIQVGLFCVWVAIVSIIWPKDVPALPLEARTLHGWGLWKKCLRGMIPSLGLIFLVLGTIFMGLATPTEAGAMGVVGALALAASYGTLTWRLLYQGMASTMRLTAMVVYILIGGAACSKPRVQGVGRQGVDRASAHTRCRADNSGFFIFANAVHLRGGVFSSTSSRSLSSSSRCSTPVADKLGIDLVWFGVLNLRQHPDQFHASPFGFALFYLRGIAHRVIRRRISTVGAIPWVVLQVILVVIVIFWPGSVTYWLDKPCPRRPIQDRDPMPQLPSFISICPRRRADREKPRSNARGDIFLTRRD